MATQTQSLMITRAPLRASHAERFNMINNLARSYAASKQRAVMTNNIPATVNRYGRTITDGVSSQIGAAIIAPPSIIVGSLHQISNALSPTPSNKFLHEFKYYILNAHLTALSITSSLLKSKRQTTVMSPRHADARRVLVKLSEWMLRRREVLRRTPNRNRPKGVRGANPCQ